MSADLEARGRALVEALSGGDFAGAAASFDGVMAAALPAPKLAAVWAQVTGQAGDFAAIEGVSAAPAGAHAQVLVTCRFARAALVVKIIYDGGGRVAGLFFVPPEASAPWSPPPYARPDAFTEREVQVGGAPALPGVITLPHGQGPFPAVVLVHGSGPSDADETIGPNKVFKDLAWGLASRGVAALRYVKRSRHAPATVVGVKEEVIDGACAAVDLLRTIPEINRDRVVVLGHSQGGEMAPRVAVEAPSVAGLVMLAPSARPLQDLVVDQFAYLATLDPAKLPLVDEARAFKQRVEDPALGPEDEVVFPGGAPVLPAAYLLSLRGYDPAATAAGLSVPMLILFGDRDYQVTGEDRIRYERALSGRPGVTIRRYPDLHHLFMPGEGPPRPEEYAAPGHVDARVIEDVAAFVLGMG